MKLILESNTIIILLKLLWITFIIWVWAGLDFNREGGGRGGGWQQMFIEDATNSFTSNPANSSICISLHV